MLTDDLLLHSTLQYVAVTQTTVVPVYMHVIVQNSMWQIFH